MEKEESVVEQEDDDDIDADLMSLVTAGSFPWDLSDSDSDANSEFPDEDEHKESDQTSLGLQNRKIIRQATRKIVSIGRSERGMAQIQSKIEDLLKPYQNELNYWESGQVGKTFEDLRNYITSTPEPLFSAPDDPARAVEIEGEKPIASAYLLSMKNSAVMALLDKNLKRLINRYKKGRSIGESFDKQIKAERRETGSFIWSIIVGSEENRVVWDYLRARSLEKSDDGTTISVAIETCIVKFVWISLDEEIANDRSWPALHLALAVPNPSVHFFFVDLSSHSALKTVILADGTTRTRAAILRDRLILLMEVLSKDALHGWRAAVPSCGYTHLLDTLSDVPPQPQFPVQSLPIGFTGRVFSMFFSADDEKDFDPDFLCRALLDEAPDGPRSVKFKKYFTSSNPTQYSLSRYPNIHKCHDAFLNHLNLMHQLKNAQSSNMWHNGGSVVEPLAALLAGNDLLTRMFAGIKHAILHRALIDFAPSKTDKDKDKDKEGDK